MKPSLRTCVGKALFLLLFTFLLNTTYSQHFIFGGDKARVEVGLNFGPTFFLGDLGGNYGKGSRFVKDLNLELTKMMKGAFLTVYPNRWLGLRVAGQITHVAGQDYIIGSEGVNELWRKQRNLDFRSNMWEVYGAIEVYPTMIFNFFEDWEPRLKPYGFIGAGLFHFDPEGSITDANGRKTWHKLHPLRTEGQGMSQYPDKKPYKLTQMNIPMGAGVKFKVTDRFSTAFELLYRKTFTDYIDDVSTTYIDPNHFDLYLSPADATIARKIHDKTIGIVTPGVTRYEPGTQRGNSHQMDAYFSFVLKAGIQLGYTSEAARNSARQTRCPHFY